jgi:hypothetical protein
MMSIREAARECLGETDALIRRFGPRLAGTEAARKAAQSLADSLAGCCDSSRLEPFAVHPASFYSYTKVLPVSYALGALALFLPRPLSLLPATGLAAGVILMLCQFGLYLHFPDFLFPKKEGWNVSAVLEPKGEARRELILSAHHDSAPVARIFSGPFAKFYAPAIFLPYAFFFLELYLLVARLAGAAAPELWALAALSVGLLPVAAYFALVDTGRGSPGAGDNLVSAAMIARIARGIADDRGALLRSTRLRIVSFDAEEAGLRGSAAWFRAHAAELSRLPCAQLNFDSLYALRDLQALTTDVNGAVPLSSEMHAELMRCAAQGGHAMRPFAMLFGGGATDAAEGARAGIPSASIVAMPTSIVRDDLVYHTPRDNVDRIEPEVIAACIDIALRYLASLEAAIEVDRP